MLRYSNKKKDIIMVYEFKTDLNIEYPFFLQMAAKLGGVKRRDNFNGKETFKVQCPNGKKHKAVMGCARTGNTYVLACHVDGCTLNGASLHDLIKRHGGKQMFDEWRKARWTDSYAEERLPIKNRVPYAERKTPHKKSFREKQDLKPAVLQSKVQGEQKKT